MLAAYRSGQRLDGWTEWFDEGRWLAAFEECERVHGVGLDWFAHRRRRLDEVLPWDRIDCGVTRPYLQKQLAAARNLAEVPDCVLEPCSVCGACDYEVVKNRTYEARGLPAGAGASPARHAGADRSTRTSGSATRSRGAWWRSRISS